MEKIVYLDNNATTAVDKDVFDAMSPFLTVKWGNPSSMHAFGGRVKVDIENARQSVAKLLGVKDVSEIVFTSGGTESDNSAIIGALRANPEKKHIVTSKVEHPAVLSLCNYLQNTGYDVSYIGVNSDGELNLDELEKSIRKDTAIVSIMYANNETGVVFPIKEISKITRKNNVLLHTDAVQAVGKIDIDVNDLGVDFLSLSGHKIHAPKGVGVLYVRKNVPFKPFMMGGHQEWNMRGGTENTASIVGLGKACEIAKITLLQDITHIKKLRDKLEKSLLNKIAGSKINGFSKQRLPNTLNISFEFIEGESILLMLDEKNICASSGSACTSGSLQPSHVLRAMNVPSTFVQGSIRFSLSKYNTEQEIDYVVDTLVPIVKRLREISPYC